MKKIVNIAIYYANEDEILAYANSLSRQSIARDISLVVVVNKEEGMSLDIFKSKLADFELDTMVFNPNVNLGYMNGLIYGYKQYSEEAKDIPSWVVMSNTDIQFSNDRFFEHFLGASYEDDVWCVAPSVYSPANNSYNNPQRIERYKIKELNRRISIFERPAIAHFYIKLAGIKAKLIKKAKKNSQFVYSAHGCFFIICGEFAEVLKHKKYNALMYSEEAYIAEIIRTYGKKCFYDSTIEVIHNKSTITRKLGIRKRSKYFADSLKLIRDEFFK